MDTIELEIQEIEALISLQRRKVDLLRKKNELIMRDMPGGGGGGERTGTGRTTSKVAEEDSLMVAASCTNNPLVGNETKDLDGTSPRQSSSAGWNKFEIGNRTDSASSNNNNDSRNDNDRPSFISMIRESIIGPDVQKLKEQEEADEKAEEEKEKAEGKGKDPVSFVDALTRLSRLNTDLANERNLLAWGRTALAAARTCLAFMGLEGVNAFGAVTARFCVIAFAVFATGIMALGLNRYKKIKHILGLRNPPIHFHRMTNTPMFTSMVGVFLLAFIVVCFNDWRKD